MTDVLDLLRDENPVAPDGVRVTPGLRARVLDPSPPPRRRGRGWRGRVVAVAGAGALAVGVAAAVLTGGTERPPDLAARAVAATSAPGVIHWVTEQQTTSNGHPLERLRIEGWTGHGVTHVVRSKLVGGRAVLRSDARTASGRVRTYLATDDDYVGGPAGKGPGANPLADGDPFAIFRRAYRTGRLTADGPDRFVVDLPGRDDTLRPVYRLDPRTAKPVSLALASSTQDGPRHYDNVLTLRFVTYEVLPDSAAARARLDLLAHPGAGPKDDPVAPHFAVLRGGGPPTGRDLEQLQRLAQGGGRGLGRQLDPTAARRLRTGQYLLPGPGRLCLVTIDAQGVGGGCRTLAQVLRSGFGAPAFASAPGGGLRRLPYTIVVPDGIRAVRVRVRGGRRAVVGVEEGVAVVPGETYRWGLLHERP